MKDTTILEQIPTQQHIKSMHLKEIFLKTLKANGISRAQLKREMQLSFPSVSALVEELLSYRILQEERVEVASGRGRPSILLRVNPDALAIPVVNMTRDGYQFCLYDCCGQPLSTCALPYAEKPADAEQRWQPDAETLCRPLTQLLSALRETHFMADLVLSVPAGINAQGILTSSALHFTVPPDFLTCLEETTGLALHLINNSDAEAYGEKLFQPLPEDFVFLHVGKGVGAGIIRKGRIFDNGHLRAGEIGHISIDYNGHPCSCGNRGCLERYIDISQLQQEAAPLLPGCSGFDELAEAYRSGNPEITALINSKARLLAVGISNMLAMQPVTHIVLGGSIEKLGDGFLEALREAIGSFGFRKYMNRVTVTFTRAGADAGLVGAVWNYIDHVLAVETMYQMK